MGSKIKPVKSVDEFRSEEPGFVSLPFGQCIVHEKWRGQKFMELLLKDFQIHYRDDQDFLDFQPSSQDYIALLSESDIAQGEEYIRKKLARLYKFANKNPGKCLQPAAIYHTTELTNPYFYRIQILCVLEFSIPIIPVDRFDQIPQILERFKVATKLKNPLKLGRPAGLKSDKEMMLALINVPTLSEKSARNLLGKFGTLRAVIGAKETQLAEVIGPNSARGVYDFFHRKNTV